MGCEPDAVSAGQGHGGATGSNKGFVVLIEPGGCPGCDAPCDVLVAEAKYRLRGHFEVGDVAPDTFPLVATEVSEPGHDIGTCSKRHDIVGKYAFRCVVIDPGAQLTQQSEPALNGDFRVRVGDWYRVREMGHMAGKDATG